jgi:outer membrane protein assembly factor BamB
LNRRSLTVVFALFCIGCPQGFAKRIAPKPVPPIVHEGVQYSASGDGKTGSVVATDISTGKELWRVKIFRVHPRWWKGEEDNQWVYISSLRLTENTLLIANEKGQCFLLDLRTKSVKRESCPED